MKYRFKDRVLVKQVTAWKSMVELEPEAAEISQLARTKCREDIFVNGYEDHPRIAQRLKLLVGHLAEKREQRSPEAYQRAVNRIKRALPACGNCDCHGRFSGRLLHISRKCFYH